MHRVPPVFFPGPLTRSAAELLNQLARDLYLSLYGHFSAAPPINLAQDVNGVRLSLDPLIVEDAIGSSWFNVSNASGEVIPAYGLMQVSGIDTNGLYTVVKPNASDSWNILINDGTAIPIGGTGRGHNDSPAHVHYNTADGTPAADEEWGVTSGSWKLESEENGARIIGDVDAAAATVLVYHSFGRAQGIAIRKNNAGTVFAKKRLNVNEGAGVTLTLTFDDVADEVELTIAASGASLTVEEVDGSPSYTSTTTLRVDQADGFQLSQPGAGIVRLDLLTQMSVTADASGIKLVNDSAGPGNSKYYGTDSGGTKGYFSLPSGGISTLQDVDASPSYTSLTILQVDQADGLTISNPAGGTGRLDWELWNLTNSTQVSLADYLAFADVSLSNANRKGEIAVLHGLVKADPGGRLTLTTATPVTTADVTAATTAYYALYAHGSIKLFSSSTWYQFDFAELSIKATDTQTGTTTNGSTNVTGLTNTSQLVRGMEVTAASGIAGGTTIAAIPSSTTITLSTNATASGSRSLTFKLPASKNYDVLCVVAASQPALRWTPAWTDDTTRAHALGRQDGVNMNNAAINATDSNGIAAKEGLYLGTVRTTATAGQMEDSAAKRLVFNAYHRVWRPLSRTDTGTWNYTLTTPRSANASTANRVEIVAGLAEGEVWVQVDAVAENTTAGTAHLVGIDEDGTTANDATVFSRGETPNNGATCPVRATLVKAPTVGYHFYQWLEWDSGTTGTTTWHGNTAAGISGLTGGWHA